MNKKKLTLLIALSIICILILDSITFRVKATKTETPVVAITQDSVKKAVVIEEVVIEEEPIKVIPNDTIIAYEVWNLMKSLGWSDDLCAGILGNMAAECGSAYRDDKGEGHILLNPNLYGDSGTSYGLCQWHAGRMRTLLNNYGTEIESQIAFLAVELQSYPKILNSNGTYKEIAYAFCVDFERPSNRYDKAKVRQRYAEIAYDLFAK